MHTGDLKWYAKEQDDEVAASGNNNNSNNNNELDFKHTAEEIAKSFSPEEVRIALMCTCTCIWIFGLC